MRLQRSYLIGHPASHPFRRTNRESLRRITSPRRDGPRSMSVWRSADGRTFQPDAITLQLKNGWVLSYYLTSGKGPTGGSGQALVLRRIGTKGLRIPGVDCFRYLPQCPVARRGLL